MSRRWCSVKNSYGYACGIPGRYVVYLDPEDAEIACGKHLVALIKTRLADSETRFVKVATIEEEAR